MNKKIVCLTITLLTLAMLVVPPVAACRNRENKRWENFSAFMVSGPPIGAPVVTFYPEPPQDPIIKTIELQETVVVCELTFGDEMYELGTDFTYESQLTLKLFVNSDPVFGRLKAVKTITFNPASPNHDIDGTLEFFVTGTAWPEPNPDPDDAMDSWGTVLVYGTGDLQGVRVRAVGWQDDSENIIYQGRVKGWPV